MPFPYTSAAAPSPLFVSPNDSAVNLQNNILIGQDGHAYISDIGIHRAVSDSNFSRAWRYRPFRHEYEQDKELVITKDADIHALGMLAYEIYSDHKPFAEYKDSPRTIVKLVAGGFPELNKPDNMPETIWEIVQQCIDYKGKVPRPTMQDIVDRLSTVCD